MACESATTTCKEMHHNVGTEGKSCRYVESQCGAEVKSQLPKQAGVQTIHIDT
jgi:hypothetical protein